MPRFNAYSPTENIKIRQYCSALFKHFRKEAKISQKLLSKLIGTTYQQVQKYENGSNIPNMITFFKMCAVLNIHWSLFDKVKYALVNNEDLSSPSLPHLMPVNKYLLYNRKYFEILDKSVRDVLKLVNKESKISQQSTNSGGNNAIDC